MSRRLVSIQICAIARSIPQGQSQGLGRNMMNTRMGMATDCDDPACGKEQNYWKGKIEMPEYNYLQPKRPQFDATRSTDVKEKPDVPRHLDIYKERNCRIIQDCKKAAQGDNRPKCKKGV